MGSSAKSLYPRESHGGPPLALVHLGDRLKFFTSPEDIQQETRTYSTDLFTRQDHPAVQKPWMETPSVIAIKEQTSQDPFTWPVAMTVDPGPDRWEKWCVKSLSDTALRLVLQLVNYEICNSHFPASVKPTNMTTIYKHGPKTSLANYRRICCSNFLLNIPFAWLNSLLIPYLVRLCVLPKGQVATQPGMQGRDLTSFLSQLENQQKGFDKLEPQGFYDAISAYGLPHSIVDFDSSAQSEIPYCVHTAYGLTEPLTITGVTKQGGLISPLKSTLTTSLGNHWLHDLFLTHQDGVIISSIQHMDHREHIPVDRLLLALAMCEATNDSLLVAGSVPSLE
ncbi:hypothetical protein F4604DRAFT_1877236 [Suillus subluteus]|nr:hypothetical protein F4604DRAFT_1877236 [Suillus subluteus]